MSENPNMKGFDLRGEVVTMPVFMAGFAIDGRTSSKKDIEQLEVNTKRLIAEGGHVPPINFGHMFCQPEEPIRGFVQDVRAEIHTDGEGKPLFGLIADIFLFEDTAASFKEGRFPKVSAEIATSISTHTGEELGPTLMGVAMLGSSVPAFPQLSAGGFGNTLQAMNFSVFYDKAAQAYKHTDLSFNKGKTRLSNKFSQLATKLFDLLSDNSDSPKQNTFSEDKPMATETEASEVDKAGVASKLRTIAADISSLADEMEGAETAEPSEKDEAPEGPSMTEEHAAEPDEDKEDEKATKKNSAEFNALKAENDKLKASIVATETKAKVQDVNQAFNALQAKGQIAQGQKLAFETLADSMGLDSAVATFATTAGVPTPSNATPLEKAEPVTGLAESFGSLGEISANEMAQINGYKNKGYGDDNIVSLIQATRTYNKKKGVA